MLFCNLVALNLGLNSGKGLRVTAHYGKSSISIFQQFFASTDNIFILGVRLGTRLLFYETF